MKEQRGCGTGRQQLIKQNPTGTGRRQRAERAQEGGTYHLPRLLREPSQTESRVLVGRRIVEAVRLHGGASVATVTTVGWPTKTSQVNRLGMFLRTKQRQDTLSFSLFTVTIPIALGSDCATTVQRGPDKRADRGGGDFTVHCRLSAVYHY